MPEGAPDAAGYIRGGGGVAVSGRKAITVLAYLAALILALSAVWLGLATSDQNHRAASLHHGVPVQATVTGCVGVSSGIGMAIEYWQCRVSYTYAGQAYQELLGGSRTRLAAGQTVPAVVARSSPAVISTVEGAPKGGSYAASIVLGGAAGLLLVAVLVKRPKRTARSPVSA